MIPLILLRITIITAFHPIVDESSRLSVSFHCELTSKCHWKTLWVWKWGDFAMEADWESAAFIDDEMKCSDYYDEKEDVGDHRTLPMSMSAFLWRWAICSYLTYGRDFGRIHQMDHWTSQTSVFRPVWSNQKLERKRERKRPRSRLSYKFRSIAFDAFIRGKGRKR